MLSHAQKTAVRFEDADPAGVIFYPRAFALAHAAVEEMIRRSSLGWGAWFASAEHAAPLRHAEAEFLRPLRAGEEVMARARVAEMGRTSVTFEVALENLRGETAARLRATHVLIRRDTGEPVELTPAIRSAFA